MGDRSGRSGGRAAAAVMDDAAAALAALCTEASSWRYRPPTDRTPWSWTISDPPLTTLTEIQRWCVRHAGSSCRMLAGSAGQSVYIVTGPVVLARVPRALRHRHGNRWPG